MPKKNLFTTEDLKNIGLRHIISLHIFLFYNLIYKYMLNDQIPLGERVLCYDVSSKFRNHHKQPQYVFSEMFSKRKCQIMRLKI